MSDQPLKIGDEVPDDALPHGFVPPADHILPSAVIENSSSAGTEVPANLIPSNQPVLDTSDDVNVKRRIALGGGAGALISGGQLVGTALGKSKKAVDVLYKMYNGIPPVEGSMSGLGPNHAAAAANPLYARHGIDTLSGPANAEHNATMRFANELRANPTLDSSVDSLLRDRSAMAPLNAEQMRREINATKPFLTKIAENPLVNKTGSALGTLGKFGLSKAVPILGLAGASGLEGDMENRWHHAKNAADYGQAILSGLGAAGSAAATWPYQPPMFRAAEGAVGMGAPALNYGIDKYIRGSHYAAGGLAQPKKFDEGGGVRLSQDEVINNALNRPSKLDIAKKMGSMLADQGKKEFKSYAKPHAFTDVVLSLIHI